MNTNQLESGDETLREAMIRYCKAFGKKYPGYASMAFEAGAQWQQSQPGIKQWVSEDGEQAFEQFPQLAKYLQHAAHNWKTDGTWSGTLAEINNVCAIALTTPKSDMVSKTEIINKLQTLKDFHHDEGNSMSSIAIGEAIEKIKEL